MLGSISSDELQQLCHEDETVKFTKTWILRYKWLCNRSRPSYQFTLPFLPFLVHPPHKMTHGWDIAKSWLLGGGKISYQLPSPSESMCIWYILTIISVLGLFYRCDYCNWARQWTRRKTVTSTLMHRKKSYLENWPRQYHVLRAPSRGSALEWMKRQHSHFSRPTSTIG